MLREVNSGGMLPALPFEALAEMGEENPVLYGVFVVVAVAIEGMVFALIIELLFRLLGLEMEEMPHH